MKKPKANRARPAPRQVWIVWTDDRHGYVIPASATTRKEALGLVEDPDERVVGPYVLAERRRER